MDSVQTLEAAAMECCKLGMRLVDFPDDAAYADFWAGNPPLELRWVYMGATYNYGDGTDRWCHTMETVPKSIITNNFDAYENCTSNDPSRARLVFVGDKTSDLTVDNLAEATDYACLV
jgi:hypothetical protein